MTERDAEQPLPLPTFPGFNARRLMIEQAWLRDESRSLPVPPLFGEGYTLGLVEGAHLEWHRKAGKHEG